MNRPKLVVLLSSAVVGASVGGIIAASTAGAEQSKISRTNPPPIPHIVNPNGTINSGYFRGVSVWEPPGYKGPLHYVTPQDFAVPSGPPPTTKIAP